MLKTIDRLIIKAQQKNGLYKLITTFIEPSEVEPNKWILSAGLWNGITGNKPKEININCSSISEAIQRFEELKRKYPNDEGSPIIIDDIPKMEKEVT